jgi:hypothetical protein
MATISECRYRWLRVWPRFSNSITAPNAARATFVRCLAGTAHGDLWSEKSFANVSEVAGNSRIKM